MIDKEDDWVTIDYMARVFNWKDRRGELRTIAVPTTGDLEKDRDLAMAIGYPGHAGGRWNWFIYDAHEWFRRKGWVPQSCPCYRCRKGL